MVGVELPVLAMEHMYVLTEPIPEVIAYNESTGEELIHGIDFGGEIYLRQEGQGLLLGTLRAGPEGVAAEPDALGLRPAPAGSGPGAPRPPR